METLRNFAEIGVGVLFGVGALFNATYTLTHGTEFYESFANGAWFGPGRWLVEHAVIPNATLATIVIVLVEAALALMILLRGDLVRPALLAGAVFATTAAAASSPGGTVGNLALATIMVILALSH